MIPLLNIIYLTKSFLIFQNRFTIFGRNLNEKFCTFLLILKSRLGRISQKTNQGFFKKPLETFLSFYRVISNGFSIVEISGAVFQKTARKVKFRLIYIHTQAFQIRTQTIKNTFRIKT